MILFKPDGIAIPQELLTEFYYANSGQMYMINSDGVTRVTDTDEDCEKLNVPSGELIVVVTTDIPCLMVGDLIYAQCGVMRDLAVHHELRELDRISHSISADGMINLLDKVIIPGPNGKWCILKDKHWSIPSSFIKHDSGIFMAAEIKKKLYYPPPSPPPQHFSSQQPSAIGLKRNVSSVNYGGITFGEINAQRQEFITRQSNFEYIRYARAYVGQISIGSLQDFEFATTDVIMSVSSGSTALMTPTPAQIEEFLMRNGVKATEFTVIRMNSQTFQFDKQITLRKNNDITLTSSQRRFIIGFLVRNSGLSGEERDTYREQLQTLSDLDLATQTGVEKSGYSEIKN